VAGLQTFLGVYAMTTEYSRGNSRATFAAADTTTAARRYMKAGLAIIPLPPGAKKPGRSGWQKESWTLEDVPRLWPDSEGIGCLWGTPSGGRIDVDLDWKECQVAARHIMAPTRTWGCPGARQSHRVYKVTDQVPRSKKYELTGNEPGRRGLEILSTWSQSLLPPSLHGETGETREWDEERPATEITCEELLEQAVDTVTAAFIARSWPGQGSRHDYVLSATGYLIRHLPRERAERIMWTAITAADDEERRARFADVDTTIGKYERGQAITGGPRLEQLVPGAPDQIRR